MANKERLSDISPFKNVITVVGISVVAAACRQEVQVASPATETPAVPSSPTFEVPTPTAEIFTPIPEASPAPTVATEEPPAVVVEPTPIAQPTPTREPQPIPEPTAEICDVTGLCHGRTERRMGMTLEGYVFPNGLVYRYTGDPDTHFQGRWVITGRIAEIIDHERGIFRMNVGKGGETLLINVRWMQGQPDDTPRGSYARLWTYQLGVLWNVAMPEVNPRLGAHLLEGDYVQVYTNVASNAATEEQNYQRTVEVGTQGTLFTYLLEMIQ